VSKIANPKGDPLFHLLFVLMIEALGKLISTAVSGGLLFGFSVGTRVDTSHLLFADVTLLFCGVNQIIFAFYGAYFYYLK
jgi:hypothetical protein